MKKYKWFLVLFIILCTPLVINLFFINGDIETGKYLGNKEWLAFWGSYIGGVTTLIAVLLTLNQNRVVIDQNRVVIDQNKEMLNFQEEQYRISIMPVLDVRISLKESLHMEKLHPPNGFIILNQESNTQVSSLPKEYSEVIDSNMLEESDDGITISTYMVNLTFIRLVITQKTHLVAMNVQLSMYKDEKELSITPHFVLASEESVKLPLLIDKNFPSGDYKFILRFQDTQGRSYHQFFNIKIEGYDKYSLKPISTPNLN
ncbi:hypothetical protein HMI01_15310 [Halolactibacillus miurensis]|uniref:Uncharacterized protein n=1 Tax=Halolactibacillus miurensis TaxID=306541 RepID=A0A1I6RYG5_9BACI|nr:hypothetical protein [Halolactibacillus miurensis]GEM04543.1 hypothetical protein HMI01_15310 [Halolactibacillus miurensis]SFS69732.1 hypothetical protein SAMN05421668_10732 [Halolactibacillus miurensis]